VRDHLFREDLSVLMSGGVPLWDGLTQVKVTRRRLPTRRRDGRALAPRLFANGDIDGDEKGWIAFLVALSDPSRR
jgi:hypothetical protein